MISEISDMVFIKTILRRGDDMAKGWKLEPGRHALAARGVPTGRKSYVSSSVSKDKYKEDSEQGRIARQARHESLADVVKRVATDEQRETLMSFEPGDEYQFLMMLNRMQKAPADPDLITPKMIDETLEIMVNSVEGDTTQMPHGLIKYAAKKGWLMHFLTEVEIKEALGEIKPQGLAGKMDMERQKKLSSDEMEREEWEAKWETKKKSIPDLADYFLGPDPRKTEYYKQMKRMEKE
jgi:hypothetical protein